MDPNQQLIHHTSEEETKNKHEFATLSDVHFAKAIGSKHRHLFHTCPNTIPGDFPL